MSRPLVLAVGIMIALAATVTVGFLVPWRRSAGPPIPPAPPSDRGDSHTLTGVLYRIPTRKGEKDKEPLAGVVLRFEQAAENLPTDDAGGYRVRFHQPLVPGRDVRLKAVTADDHIVIHPDLKGRLRLPADGAPVDVWVVRKGDKFLLSDQTLERFVEDVSDGFAKKVQPEHEVRKPDMGAALRELAVEFGLDEATVVARLREWIQVTSGARDARKRGLAAFAEGKYALARQLFREDAAAKAAVAARLLREAAASRELAGDAAKADRDYKSAAQEYELALAQLANEPERGLREAVELKLAIARIDYANTGPPEESAPGLKRAVDRLRFLAERPVGGGELPSRRAEFRRALGHALFAAGKRRGGPEAVRLLEEGVTAYGAALDEFTRDRSPAEWAWTQSSLACLLTALAEREGVAAGQARFDAAEKAARAALEVHTPDRPKDWAVCQANLGIVLIARGNAADAEVGRQSFESAVEVFEKVVGVYPRTADPINWAIGQLNLALALAGRGKAVGGMAGRKDLEVAVRLNRAALPVLDGSAFSGHRAVTQTHLGDALAALGELVGDGGLTVLREAETAYREALRAVSREHAPWAWARLMVNLGNAVQRKGSLATGPEAVAAFEAALTAYRSAAEVFTRDAAPTCWAMVRHSAGSAFHALGEWTPGEPGMKLFKQAAEAYDDALAVRTAKVDPDAWGQTKFNYANLCRSIARRTAGAAGLSYFDRAEDAYREALKVLTRKRTPRGWASTLNNLGSTLLAHSGRVSGERGLKLVREAADTFRTMLEAYGERTHPQEWGSGRWNLGLALKILGERVAGADGVASLDEAATAFRDVLRVLTAKKDGPYWARVQHRLGHTLLSLGERSAPAERARFLDEAATAVAACFEVYTAKDHPNDWAIAKNDLGLALLRQGKLTAGDAGVKAFQRAEAAFADALTVFTKESSKARWVAATYNRGLVLHFRGDRTAGEPGVTLLRKAAAAYREALAEINDPGHRRVVTNDLDRAEGRIRERAPSGDKEPSRSPSAAR